MSLVNDCLEDIQDRRAQSESGFDMPSPNDRSRGESHVVGIVGTRGSRFYEKTHSCPCSSRRRASW